MGRPANVVKVLVTGGGGFLGSAICRQLRARGNAVAAYQRSPAPGLASRGIEVMCGDLQELSLLRQAMRGCDAVIHTAGKAGAWGAYEDYHAANVTGTANVLQCCRHNGIRWLVHTSSPSVVHGGGDIEGGDESLPYPDHYAAPYPATKARAERLVLAANDPDLRAVALRPHLIWGPGDPHLLPRLIERAKGGRVPLPGADKLIDTVYVENAADAHLLALDRLAGDGACAGRPYFISNGEPIAQKKIIQGLLRAAGMEANIVPVPPAVARAAGWLLENTWKLLRLDGEPPITRWAAEQLSTAHWYDISSARAELGYRPRISIAEGLECLTAHFERGDSRRIVAPTRD